MAGKLLTRQEVKEMGHQVGWKVGWLGYLSAVLGAWAWYELTRFLSTGHNPFKEQVAHPTTGGYISGAILGVLLTLAGTTIWVWKMDYSGRPFQMEDAGASMAAGVAQGVGAFFTLVIMIMYALTIWLMWVLGAAMLIAVVAL